MYKKFSFWKKYTNSIFSYMLPLDYYVQTSLEVELK